jgi:CubicO group peptidase (beta-lactamase class C family)
MHFDLPRPRRIFLAQAAALGAGLASADLPVLRASEQTPVTGAADPRLEPFDRLMTSFVAEHQAPGAALAVTRHGKLVYARGFGYADLDAHEPVEPTSLFRIASVSKPITAVAVLQLVERGKLRLDDPVLDRMALTPHLSAGGKPDDRWKRITIQHCLQHTGGWDRDTSGDPIGRAVEIALAVGVPPPARPVDIVRYMMGQPLDFDPGAKHVYSNLGYLVLGRIIEAVTGEKYEAHVKKEVLTPLGIQGARLGRTLPENRAAGEVKYYDSQQRMAKSIYPPHQPAPLQYGAQNIEGYEAHGGWIASAVELVRLASAFDPPRRCPLLRAATITEMFARPAGPAGYEPDGKPKAAYYGCGWSVRPIQGGDKVNEWHGGFIAGSEALLVRRWDGLNWAVIFNTALAPDGERRLVGLIDGLIHRAADQIESWPPENQFSKLLT